MVVVNHKKDPAIPQRQGLVENIRVVDRVIARLEIRQGNWSDFAPSLEIEPALLLEQEQRHVAVDVVRYLRALRDRVVALPRPPVLRVQRLIAAH